MQGMTQSKKVNKHFQTHNHQRRFTSNAALAEISIRLGGERKEANICALGEWE